MDELICWECGWQGIDVAIVDDVQICVACLILRDNDEAENNFLDEIIEFGGEG